MEERERLDKLMYPDAPPETVQALTSRVCEKDTVSDVEEDVVDVKCLEGSPTALWMEEYYRLGHRHQDLNVFINKVRSLNSVHANTRVCTTLQHVQVSGHTFLECPQFGDFEGVELQKGLAIKVGRAEDCAAACLMTPSHTASGTKIFACGCWVGGRPRRAGQDRQILEGALSSLPCNAFSFCSAEVCFEAGKGKQTRGDCWLQFIEAPGAPLVSAARARFAFCRCDRRLRFVKLNHRSSVPPRRSASIVAVPKRYHQTALLICSARMAKHSGGVVCYCLGAWLLQTQQYLAER
eukprot:366268-Chlamydomonas_euryale.AAC.9